MSKNRSLWGALNLSAFTVAAIAGAYLLYYSTVQKYSGAATPIGHVLEKTGTVQVRTGRSQGWSVATQNTPIFNKTSVYTQKSSKTALKIRGAVIQVEERTLIQIIDPQRQAELFVDFGTLQLSAQNKEQIVLNIGGRKLKLSLNQSTVKIKREKRTGQIKIASVRGPVRIENENRKATQLLSAQEVKIPVLSEDREVAHLPEPEVISLPVAVEPPAIEIPPPEIKSPPTPVATLKAESPTVAPTEVVAKPTTKKRLRRIRKVAAAAPAKVERQVQAEPEFIPSAEPKRIARQKTTHKSLVPEISDASPWAYEVGGGANYLDMSMKSTISAANTRGLSGPTLFAAVERKFGNLSIKGSVLDVNTKMSISSDGENKNEILNWRSFWLGSITAKVWKLPRLEFGLSYQDLPLFHEDATGTGAFEKSKILSATLGFNAVLAAGKQSLWIWNQRLLIPVQSSAGNEIESFKPRLGTEGTVGYYHCLNRGWALGGAWFGQYAAATYSLPKSYGLLAESPSATMLNSNFQIRLQSGVCAKK